MPRKATPQALEVATVIGRIKLYCESTKTSINGLSEQAEVSQSALFRFMNGERKSVTSCARKVLTHIDSRHNWHNWHTDDKIQPHADSNLIGYSLIENAVRSLWDGSPQTAEILASLIRALKPALDIATTVTQTGSRGR